MLYFAWIPAWTTPFDPVAHARQDLDVLSLEITEEEGAAPGFTIEVRNPGIGSVIGVGNRYAVISEQATGDAQPVLLARGKVAACPSELTGAVIQLEFTGVQPNGDVALRAFADTLRTDDLHYDPLFVSESEEDTDPSSALNGRPLNFYWNRKTLEIGTSDIVTGSRIVDIGAQALQGLQQRITEPPVRHAKMKVNASWEQRAQGFVDISGQFGRALGNGKSFASYTYEDVQSWWPSVGSGIGDATGWTVRTSKLSPTGDHLSPWIDGGSYFPSPQDQVPATQIQLRSRSFRIDALTASYAYSQPRDETIEILAEIGIQDVLGDDRVETLSPIDLRDVTVDPLLDDWKPRRPYNVGDKISWNSKVWQCQIAHTSADFFAIYVLVDSPDGGSSLQPQWKVAQSDAPLQDARRAAYFSTDRGRRSVEHAIEILRCFLLKRARCIEMTFDVTWTLGRDLTVDDSVRVEWSQIPGGEATGKVTKLSLRADGRGNRLASITANVSVGTGNPSDPPEFAESDYFDPTEDYSSGDYDTPIATSDRETATDVVYSWPTLIAYQPVDPFQLDNAGYAVTDVSAVNTANSQLSAAWFAGAGGGNPVAAIRPTGIKVRMRQLAQIDNVLLSYLVTCKPMQSSRGINLGITS